MTFKVASEVLEQHGMTLPATDPKYNHGVLKVILHMILGTNHNMMRWLDQIAKNNINVV